MRSRELARKARLVGGRGCGADGLELGLEQVLKEAPPPYDPPCRALWGVAIGFALAAVVALLVN